jgi:hypothetical protein
LIIGAIGGDVNGQPVTGTVYVLTGVPGLAAWAQRGRSPLREPRPTALQPGHR